ncbi:MULTISPECIES: phage tail protein [Enterococcus]|uniref:Phage tail protein n=1 Tax=Candidatus Enterococcus mangumiae TaxID=2230878 RepID=A0ABZ2ST44_9ENTE|nr:MULTISPECIES: phage tail protein [unclassified Enterococcus]MBO0491348.1 phage tail protein [Enterococcus sp. DIV1094]MBO1299896.1 phage tail protein [Enterococcus sp. DIV1271a]
MSNEPYFEFNGQSSLQHRMTFLDDIYFVSPEAALQFEEVDARQGSLVYSENRYKDIKKIFPVEIQRQNDQSLMQQLQTINRWVKEPKNYQPFFLSLNPNYMYQAICYEEITIADQSKDWMDIRIPFRFAPVMYSIAGLQPRSIQSGIQLENPELEIAYPLIQFHYNATSDATLSIGGRQYRILRSAGTGLVTIDSENGLAYREGNINLSSSILIHTDGYHPPILNPGLTTITFTNQLTNVRITPRWRAIAI